MTPFAPRTPKTAVAEASFSVVTDSTSEGSRVLILSLGTPSIKISGDCAFVVAAPRRNMEASSTPGCPPPDCIDVKPAILPERAFVKLPDEDYLNSIPTTLLTDPVIETFFCSPYATTTTSSNICESDNIIISR